MADVVLKNSSGEAVTYSGVDEVALTTEDGGTQSFVAGGGIASIEQTTASTDDGGTNVITVTLTNGQTATFEVKNGSTGSDGEKGETGATGRGIKSITGDDDGSWTVSYTDGSTETVSNEAYIALTEQFNQLSLEIADKEQLYPEFANSVEECTDTSKLYVLPDGYIYAYVLTETAGKGYTNLVPTSTDTDGSIYNGTGYKENVRLSSSGGVSSNALAGSVTTGFMPYTHDGMIRMKGATWLDNSDSHLYYILFYGSDKTLLSSSFAVSANAAVDTYGMSVIYDDATGITTWDTSQANDSMLIILDSAAYFRINAYGSGADLIVTVNEEIVESKPIIEYQWASTGHAFIPADYEDRIVALEKEAAENKETVAELKQQVEDILDGTTEIAASTKFDPTVYGLPVLYLEGDISPIKESKDNKVTVAYAYGDYSGSCTLKGQGATSYKTAQALGDKGKFNYTIKLDQAVEVVEGWGAQKKYCLKANFIDHTHSRNIVSCKLWGLMVKSRDNVPDELANLPNGGAIDGFPIVIMLNGEFHGLYTWNIPKDGWMFGLEEDTSKTQALVGANDHELATQFKGLLAGDESDFELEFVSDEDNADWVTTSLNRLINACINSDGSDLDTVVGQYIDWDSAIDYYIHAVVEKATDGIDKNFLLVTFDGTKWYFTDYDRDTIYGLAWDGSALSRPVSNISFDECATTSRMWELIKNYKAEALKTRYWELRSNILSESRIMQYFENFAWAIPSPVKIEDVKRWPSVPGSSVNTIDQIGRFVRQRLETVDAWIDK